MEREEIKLLFDQQAAGYDAQWARTQPLRDCLYLLLDAAFAGLPPDARVLGIGVGTGAELAYLARRNPGWRFTAVEPSGAMLDVCRRRAEAEGFIDRCEFHEGFLDTLPPSPGFDAATCFLVSQFILDRGERVEFFRGISGRLRPGGVLASTDLASDVASPEYEVLLRAWMTMMATAQVSAEMLDRMRRAYAHDVGVLPPGEITALLREGGFALPVPFFQAGLMHGWISRSGA